MIPDARMDELIRRAKTAATIGVGGADGSVYRERFSEAVFNTTLAWLIKNEKDTELVNTEVAK